MASEKSEHETVSIEKKLDSMIKCECGTEILMLPDLKATSRAIERHAVEHRKKEKDHTKAEAEENRVRDNLITQVLEKTGDSTRTLF